MTTRWGIAATGGMAAAFAEDLAHVPGAEIAFVGSTTHGIGLVAEGFPWREGDSVVTAAEEYPSNITLGETMREYGRLSQPSTAILEITAALDPELVGDVLELVAAEAEAGMTMLLATHEMAFAREVASRVAYLHQGRVLEIGSPDQVLGDPQEEATRRFLRRVLPERPPGAPS